MKERTENLLIIALACIIVGLAGGYIVYKKRGVPFVTQREQWTISIFNGTSPLTVKNTHPLRNPIMKAEYVTDVPAKFVADPFLMQDDSTWYLFFEVYNLDTAQGDIAVATSTDTVHWDYQRIVLDEPFHLSYPHVFEWDGDFYLIPESFESNSIRLYKATDFPYQWEFVTTLVDNMSMVDSSIVRYDDKWWLFSSEATKENDTLRLFYSDELEGSWQEHPMSPIVAGNNHKARMSGRILEYNDRLYRFTMDLTPSFGTHRVMAYEITQLAPDSYAEVPYSDDPILAPDGSGWNSQAMHQLDAHEISENKWIASVDGFGPYLIFGLQY